MERMITYEELMKLRVMTQCVDQSKIYNDFNEAEEVYFIELEAA